MICHHCILDWKGQLGGAGLGACKYGRWFPREEASETDKWASRSWCQGGKGWCMYPSLWLFRVMNIWYSRETWKASARSFSTMVSFFSATNNHTDPFIDPPLTAPREQDIIQKTLNAIGVRYSHMNDEILVPSRIEEERTKQTLLVRCWYFYYCQMKIYWPNETAEGSQA